MSDLINQLRRKANGYACLEQEAADRITELEAELTEWEKLKDPINLHVNLLRGVPCKLDRIQHLLHLAGATDYDYLKAANAKMSDELETERIRLAACGVVALANTPESAAKAREMKDEYRSASCDDVARLVDSEMKMRKCLEVIAEHHDELSIYPTMPDGEPAQDQYHTERRDFAREGLK
jgi:hypothetical protein